MSYSNKHALNVVSSVLKSIRAKDMSKAASYLHACVYRHKLENITIEHLYQIYQEDISSSNFDNVGDFQDSLIPHMVAIIRENDAFRAIHNINDYSQSTIELKNFIKRAWNYTDEEFDIYMRLS